MFISDACFIYIILGYCYEKNGKYSGDFNLIDHLPAIGFVTNFLTFLAVLVASLIAMNVCGNA